MVPEREVDDGLNAVRRKIREYFEVKSQIDMLNRPIAGLNRKKRRAMQKQLRKRLVAIRTGN